MHTVHAQVVWNTVSSPSKNYYYRQGLRELVAIIQVLQL
jgi:hypothetical protein